MIIWVASYPRSGNTFFRTVLHQAFGFDTWSAYPEGADGAGSIADVTGHREFTPDFRLEDAAMADELYFVKTHDPPRDNRKAIYLIRDGRATIASYYHYACNIRGDALEMADAIIGRIMFGPWAAHVMSWNPRQRPDTLLIKFEELVADPASFYPRIQEFVGREPRPDVTLPGFEQLQARNSTFFRSGSNEAWRKDFSEDDHNLFWSLHGQIMAEYGYCEPGAELFRTTRGAWRLAGDAERAQLEATRLQNELAQLTASDASVVASLPRLLDQAVAAVQNVEMRSTEHSAAVQKLVLRLTELVDRAAA